MGNKEFLNGVSKVKNIMDEGACYNMSLKVRSTRSGTVFLCRVCGMSHNKFNKAEKCCMKQRRNKSGQYEQGWRN
jgi:hypothetical protein